MTKFPVIVGWSGGKDSALALHQIEQQGKYSIHSLLTTVIEGYDRISMHGVRTELLEKQVQALGYPSTKVSIPQNCSNEIYEERMQQSLHPLMEQGVLTAAFGDLYLEDIRAYREAQTRRAGMKAVFPLWGLNTRELAHKFIEDGFRAVLVCVDTEQLDGAFVGREYNHSLLDELPQDVDPCGENGEFHTFVYDGPIFQNPIAIKQGESILRDNRFMYCDLLPRS